MTEWFFRVDAWASLAMSASQNIFGAPVEATVKIGVERSRMAAPSPALEAPTLPAVLGEFTVVGQLGEGGSGVVYAVTRDGVALALKVLRPDLELSDQEMKAFLAEAERMRRVAHSSLVPVIDAGTLPDGRPFLATPHLRGESLAERFTRRGPAPVT